MATKTKTKREYTSAVQYLRTQVARLPRLKEERDTLTEELQQRQEKVNAGTLTERALSGVKAQLDEVTRTINLCNGEYPKRILDGLTGSVADEYQRLRKRVTHGRNSMTGYSRSVADAVEELNRVNRNYVDVDQSKWSDRDKRESTQQVAEAESSLATAREMLAEVEKPYFEAVDALNEFKQDVIYGETSTT